MYHLDYTDRRYHELNIQGPVNYFYDHINGQGWSFIINSGDTMAQLVGGDRISSVRVAPKTLVILYQHINFHGASLNLENYGNSSRLFNLTNSEDGMIKPLLFELIDFARYRFLYL